VRPAGLWPSEGSVSDEAVQIAAELGLQWMATDEGVLGRSLNFEMRRNETGFLSREGAEKLYTIHRWERDHHAMNMVFRDHRISDLIGFVYSGMNSADAASDLVRNIKRAAAPVLETGRDAVLSIILDGENAWEHFAGGGRPFLRALYHRGYYAAFVFDLDGHNIEAVFRGEEDAV
jgi:alpha-amylase/alpha-mannosidase (GH57 family)